MSLINLEVPDAASDRHWFAVRVKSRHEKIVAEVARNKGFEQFLNRCHRRWSDRVKSVELLLFPGYLFCRLNPEHRVPLLTIPGVIYLVGVGKTPAPIDENEILALQAAIRSGLPAEPWPFLEVGRRVLLEDGPLAGLEGLLIEKRKQNRLVVSVSLLRRSVAVEIERNWVRLLNETCDTAPSDLSRR